MSNASQIRAQRNLQFEDILARLNTGQRRAVQSIEGPMLVVAGPGTGKTHMVAARIGSILRKPDIDARNVLCLTFTNAGVSAMRERLLKFLGPEAHKIHIYTFHSFCDSVIRANPEKFGHHELEPITELEQIELIQNILKELPYENPLIKGFADPVYYTNGLKNLFSTIKREGWTVEEINQSIQKWMEQIPFEEKFIYKVNRGKTKKGDLKAAEVAKEHKRMDRLRAGVACFPIYENKMEEARRYEFADMINWVVKAFETNDELLGFYQEQFQFILVDEYQDTNGSQHDLLHLLTNFWDTPNLFVVGDDDQSIFEFQGARLANIKEFYEQHKQHIEVVELDENYRSSKAILDASKALIDNNNNRLIKILPGINKDLKAANKKIADFALIPQLNAYDNTLQEMTDIVTQIEKLQAEGVPLEEIAVIYAKNKQSEVLQEILLRRKIPYQISRPVDILQTTLIEHIEKFLFYLDAEFQTPNSGDFQLFWLMHYRCFDLNRRDLSKLALHRSSFSRKERPSLRDLFTQPEEELSKMGIDDPKALMHFFEMLESFITDVANVPLYVLIEKVLDKSGMIRQALKEPNGLEQLQIIETFKAFVRKQVRRNPKLDIDLLLMMLKEHRNNRLSIPLQRFAEGGSKVYLTTAHGSKGLEFDHVFMLDCSKGNWEKSNMGGGFSYPPTLTFSGEEDLIESGRRLFYVAMTRAKRHLYLGFSKSNEGKRPPQPALYLNELMDILGLEEMPNKKMDEALVASVLGDLQTMAIHPRIEELPKDVIDHLLKGFKLSASAMSTYLRCPLSFYFDSVLSVPRVSSPAAAYGTAIHKTLYSMYEPIISAEGVLEKDNVISIFEQEMEKLKGYFEQHIYISRLEMGKENLGSYIDKYIPLVAPKVQLEHEIYNTEVNGVPVGGEIDRVDLYDDHVEIYDYKTGKPNRARLKEPSDKEPYGGDYWRQLQFYKYLYKSKFPNSSIQKASILYLRPNAKDELEEHTVELVGSASDAVWIWIREVYDKIMAHEFYEGCNEPDCHWCDFVKQVGINIVKNKKVEA